MPQRAYGITVVYLRNHQIVTLHANRQNRRMIDTSLMIIASIFLLAGVVKGVIGLGLPTISMGLLATVMPTVEAAAILLVPSFITNLWQMFAGPSLKSVVSRLSLMMAGVCIGTWLGQGWMTGASVHYGTIFLGFSLITYAIIGLKNWKLPAPQKLEKLLSPMVGVITGLITAATGVFVIPAVPYLQAMGFEKEELVQALGLSFTVSTLALAVNVGAEGGELVLKASETIVALTLACLGMWLGQVVRTRLSPLAFRRGFFAGLLALGMYLMIRAMFPI